MYSLLFLAFVSFILSLLLTPLVRNVFRRLGIVDEPDNGRKLHQRAIPRVGGVAIALSYALAFGVLLLTNLKGGAIVSDALPFAWRLFPAAGLVFAVGLLDDLIGLKPLHKLLGQVAASLVAFYGGIHINAVGGQNFGDWWSLPMTVLWLVACMNTVNLIDGVDGVAAGVGLFATATSLVAALMQHNVELALATLPLARCLLGSCATTSTPRAFFSVIAEASSSAFSSAATGCCGVKNRPRCSAWSPR